MIFKKYYRTRKDGVNLYVSLDVKVDESGAPLLDSEGKYIPTGFKIRKIGTEEIYDRAIDIEDAIFVYEETDIPIENK
jgi:hypothetical protein